MMTATDHTFHSEFLSELRAVDAVLDRRSGGDPTARCDPDARRIIEAVAYFATRTRQLATEEVQAGVVGAAEAWLEPLLAPEPAQALLRARPGPGMIEPALLPAHTDVTLRAPDGAEARFRTSRPLTVWPLALGRVQMVSGPHGGPRLLVELVATTPQSRAIAPLHIHLDDRGDVFATAQLAVGLRQFVRDASVIYGTSPDGPGAPLELAFGDLELDEATHTVHPLAATRSFVHFPAKAFHLAASLPEPDRPWQRAWLRLDLDPAWPSDLAVTSTVLRLFCVPIENLYRDNAQPRQYDGTSSAIPIRPQAGDADAVLHSLVGVSRDRGKGSEPLMPRHVAGGPEYWELRRAASPGETARLRLCLPEAFVRPQTIVAEALWYEPGFDTHAVGNITAELASRHIAGVDWQLASPVQTSRPPASGDAFDLLHLLSLRSKASLGVEDVFAIAERLGVTESSPLGGLRSLVADVRVEDSLASDNRTPTNRYLISLRDVPEPGTGAAYYLTRVVEQILELCSARPIETRVRSPNRQLAQPRGRYG